MVKITISFLQCIGDHTSTCEGEILKMRIAAVYILTLLGQASSRHSPHSKQETGNHRKATGKPGLNGYSYPAMRDVIRSLSPGKTGQLLYTHFSSKVLIIPLGILR